MAAAASAPLGENYRRLTSRFRSHRCAKSSHFLDDLVRFLQLDQMARRLCPNSLRFRNAGIDGAALGIRDVGIPEKDQRRRFNFREALARRWRKFLFESGIEFL